MAFDLNFSRSDESRWYDDTYYEREKNDYLFAMFCFDLNAEWLIDSNICKCYVPEDNDIYSIFF